MLAIYQGYCAVFLLGETLFCVCFFDRQKLYDLCAKSKIYKHFIFPISGEVLNTSCY